MTLRPFLTFMLVALAFSSAQANTEIVNDDFESYADDDALYAVWEPRDGSGNGPPTVLDDGILSTDDTLFPGIDGQAVDHLGNPSGDIKGSVMQHTALTPDSAISPSSTQSIYIQGDIYVGNDGSSRMTMGLRNRTDTGNILELGTYNSAADSVNPFGGPTVPEATTYAYRIVLFGGESGDVVDQPNWYFFQFDTALDIDDRDAGTTEPTPDGLVSAVDIGAAWHTYSATITPDTITLEMDLYRDGLDNGATLTAGTDVPGIDASITYDIFTGAQGFDSLRIGGPSGVSSANGVAFDNVSLSLVDADFDGDNDIDGADFLAWQLGSNQNGGSASKSDGDATGDGSVLANDLEVWKSQYGSTLTGSGVAVTAVPEPTTVTLGLLAMAGGLLASRRR